MSEYVEICRHQDKKEVMVKGVSGAEYTLAITASWMNGSVVKMVLG